MTEQLAYMITGGIQCEEVVQKDKNQLLFFNLFFGYIGLKNNRSADTIVAIREAKKCRYDSKRMRADEKLMIDCDYSISFGTDMENIQGELEKVFCYVLERDTITKEDIDAVCVTQITNHIFEMVDAVAAGNQQKALDLYYELLALKEPPMRILFLLVRQYRMLFHVKALANQGYGRKEIASKAGLHPFVAGKNMEQAKRFKMGQLRRVMEEGAQLEQDVKTGLLTDNLAVELFIVKQSER